MPLLQCSLQLTQLPDHHDFQLVPNQIHSQLVLIEHLLQEEECVKGCKSRESWLCTCTCTCRSTQNLQSNSGAASFGDDSDSGAAATAILTAINAIIFESPIELYFLQLHVLVGY